MKSLESTHPQQLQCMSGDNVSFWALIRLHDNLWLLTFWPLAGLHVTWATFQQI